MGYVTNFTLRIHANPDVQLIDKAANEKVAEVINKFLSDEEAFEYAGIFEDNSEGENYVWHTDDSYKWYDHDDDMKKLSLMIPDVVLSLEGEGEESGDIWMAYYLNGTMQHVQAEIKFAPFDPSKLK